MILAIFSIGVFGGGVLGYFAGRAHGRVAILQKWSDAMRAAAAPSIIQGDSRP